MNYVTTFFQQVGGSQWMSTLTQYYFSDASGKTFITNNPGIFVNSWIDPATIPATFKKNDVTSEVYNDAIAYFGDNNYNRDIFMVFTPPGYIPSDIGSGNCGYHSTTPATSMLFTYGYVVYPDDSAGCRKTILSPTDSFGHGKIDGFSTIGSHELAEAITDQNPAFGNNGWMECWQWVGTICYNDDEIGDKCEGDHDGHTDAYLFGKTWFSSQYFAVQGLWSNQTGSCVLPLQTNCSTTDIHWALQWTSSSAHSIYPGTQCPFYDAYHGWVGINSRIVTPSHFPQLVATGNHSVGAIAVSFGDGGWIRIGWLAGCINWPASPYVCSNTALTLFDDEYRVTGCTANCYTINSDGPLGYSASAIYEIYYLGSGSWRINKNYNVAVRTVAGFPGSGAMVVGSEVEGTFSPNSPVEMPYTTFGYSSPGTDSTLRIKGASGWVDWTPGINGHQLTTYDEHNCPSASSCPSSPPYYLSVLNANYNLQTHG